jgi:hypothetical protein
VLNCARIYLATEIQDPKLENLELVQSKQRVEMVWSLLEIFLSQKAFICHKDEILLLYANALKLPK